MTNLKDYGVPQNYLIPDALWQALQCFLPPRKHPRAGRSGLYHRDIANGILFFHIFGAIAQFERELIRERTQAGLQAARARGRFGGRPRALDEKTCSLAVSMYNDSSHAVKDICVTLGISKAT